MNLIDPYQYYLGNIWMGSHETVNYLPAAATGHWSNIVISNRVERFFNNTIRPPVTGAEEHGFSEEGGNGPD